MAERFFCSPYPYRSVENDTLIERFEQIFVSISFESDAIALVQWLEASGISPSRRRREEAGAQLVGAGGAISYIDPLLMSEIADFVMLGDGVPLVPFLAGVLRRSSDRSERLKALAAHPSFFVPSIDMVIGAKLERMRGDIDDDYGSALWVTPRGVFGRTLLVELQRGCKRGCRYCTLPSCFRPLRQRSSASVCSDIERASSDGAKFDKVGLVTPEASDHHGLSEIMDCAAREGRGISFASLRIDGLTDKMMDDLAAGGWRSLTVAPESGSDLLRKSCGKGFTNDDMLGRLAEAKRRGITNAKLYFMIGLPDETDDDIAAISSLCAKIRAETGIAVTASVSPFVPKPGTAWADREFAGEAELKRRAALLKKGKLPRGVTIKTASIREAAIEHTLTWSTSKTSSLIAEGCRRIDRIEVRKDEARDQMRRLGLIP